MHHCFEVNSAKMLEEMCTGFESETVFVLSDSKGTRVPCGRTKVMFTWIALRQMQ